MQCRPKAFRPLLGQLCGIGLDEVLPVCIASVAGGLLQRIIQVLETEWRLAIGRHVSDTDQNQAGDQRRSSPQPHALGQEGAPVVADDNDLRDAFVRKKLGEVGRHEIGRVAGRVGRLVCSPVAEQVRRNHAVRQRPKGRDDARPEKGAVRETVKEEERRLRRAMAVAVAPPMGWVATRRQRGWRCCCCRRGRGSLGVVVGVRQCA